MKKVIVILSSVLFITVNVSAQGKAPEAAVKAFNAKFPDATHVKWDKENAHNYEAEFEWKGGNYSANFSETGAWIETETPNKFNDLPEKVKTAFNAAHKGATVKETSKIENAKGETMYEVEMKQGAKTVELFYTPEGAETKEW